MWRRKLARLLIRAARRLDSSCARTRADRRADLEAQFKRMEDGLEP